MATPLTSAQNQWYQRTYGVLPNGNWNWNEQGLAILDNGDVWMFMTRCWDQFATDEETFDASWIGIIRPDGFERFGGDNWASTTVGYYPHDGPLHLTKFTPYSAVTDGQKIWFHSYDRFFEFDPTTGNIEYVACTWNGGGTTYVDAQDGKDATTNCIWITYHDGFIYFIERNGTYTSTIRRMATTPPYGVETFTPQFISSADATWAAQINPATGYPNSFNGDVLWTGTGMGIAVWDGYIYLMGTVSSAATTGWFCDAIRRYPLAGGELETLFYNRNGLAAHLQWRDRKCDFEGYNGDEYTPGLGTPQLEGWHPTNQPIMITPDGSLIGTNWSGSSFVSNHQTFGVRLHRFDLPWLISNYNTNGPLRHDRQQPIYQTLHNGTTFEESWSSFNWRVRDRDWSWRDGGTPLISHVLSPGIAHNYNAYPDTIFFIHSALSEAISNWDFGETSNGMVVGTLTPTGSDAFFDVELSFEGRILKGYARVHHIEPPAAPERVFLS